MVDANFTPTTTKEVIAAIAKVTPKPVSAVINTHWHNDHTEGNQAYRAAFPKVEFIGHASAAADMATTGASNRRQLLQLGPQMMQQLEIGVEQRKSMTGGALSDEERASHLSDIAIARQYFAEAPAVEVIPPTRTVTDRLVLTRGTRTIEILHLGRGHTAATPRRPPAPREHRHHRRPRRVASAVDRIDTSFPSNLPPRCRS